MKDFMDVYAIIKCRYSYVKMMKPVLSEHFHTYYQLVYVVSGSGYLSVNGEEISLKKGDILVIKPGIKHLLSSRNDLMTTFEVKVNLRTKALKEMLSSFPLLLTDSGDKVLQVMKRIISESKEKNLNWLEIIKYQIIELFYVIGRCVVPAASSETEQDDEGFLLLDENNKITLAAKYIERNYQKSLSLKDLAEFLTLSESHFSREFTKHFNKSPIRYLNDYRLERAKEMLRNTDCSVTQISELTGFASVHYFSRYFTKMEKVNPLKYKSGHQGDFALKLSKKL